MAPLPLASVCLVGVLLAGLLVWRFALRREGPSLRNLTVSRAWLVQHQGKDRS